MKSLILILAVVFLYCGNVSADNTKPIEKIDADIVTNIFLRSMLKWDIDFNKMKNNKSGAACINWSQMNNISFQKNGIIDALGYSQNIADKRAAEIAALAGCKKMQKYYKIEHWCNCETVITNNVNLAGNKKKEIAESNPDKIDNKTKEKRKVILEKSIPVSSGTAFLISKKGHLITNNHVIDGCTNLEVNYKEKIFSAKVLSKDKINDLALIKSNIVSDSVFSISDKNVELLEDIFVAGYPFGIAISNTVKVTKGIVSSLSGLGNNFSNIQIDAALQPGNSGGPILNLKGNVIGVAVAKLDFVKVVKDFGAIPEDTNFAVKSSVVKQFLEANNIELKQPSSKMIAREKLVKLINNGTMFLSCWMTQADIKKYKSKKVMFENLQ